MRLQVSYQYPFTNWSVFHVFHNYFYWLKQQYNYEFDYIDSGSKYDGNPCSYYSPHIMVFKNLDNHKYIIVSYWDVAEELSCAVHGWNDSKRVQLITSSGINSIIEYTPFSYLCYSKLFDRLSSNALDIEKKQNNQLFFRGYLYGKRYDLFLTKLIEMTNKILPIDQYFQEINNNKICLSLNGAGEVCNRDMEILSAKSVLLRPKLHQKFHNELMPDYHYIAFDTSNDAKEQAQIIIDKFNEIKYNIELLKYISYNGYEWYKNNATIKANVNILTKILNLQILE